MHDILDLGFYQENFLKIVTKSGQLRPFMPNVYQKQLNQIVRDKQRALEPIRLRILKCRQVGCSTWGASMVYHFTATDFHKSGLTIAHDSESTEGLFNMCKRFWEHSPERVRPMRRYSNAKELIFGNPDDQDKANEGLGSAIRIATANNLTAGRSKTFQCLHMSEKAFWKNAATVQSGLLQSIPLSAGTIILDESTANGVGGDGEQFYNDWHDSDFTNVFFKWTHNPEYEIDPGRDFAPTHYEIDLMERHPELTPRKLAFRRYKIKNEMGSALLDPQDQFRQEYPLTPEESFISSGRAVFEIEKVRADIERARAIPFKQGYFDSQGTFRDDPKGPVRIYHGPKESQGYAIGADVAEGLETGDFSAAFVLGKDMEQAASFHAHVAPDIFGRELCKMGEHFNTAMLAPEVNNHGHAVLARIKDLDYHNVYEREIREEHADKLQAKIGWQTNTKTKTLMLDNFVAAYREGHVKINDVELLKEMLTLVVGPDGDVSLNGKDRVVAACIAVTVLPRVVTPGQFKAFTPGVTKGIKDPTRMTVEQKLKMYARKRA
jgi:hypothetical protein